MKEEHAPRPDQNGGGAKKDDLRRQEMNGEIS